MELTSLGFFAVTLGFAIYCFAKKQTLLAVICGFMWFLFVIYEYNLSTGWGIYRGMAAIGTLMAFLMWLMPLYMKQRLPSEDEPEIKEYLDDIAEQRAKIRSMSRKLRGDE